MDTSSLQESTDGATEIPLIDHDVKLVIWDLDDTFWNGILAEGRIEFIHERAELVKTLAGRGIISSIASNNDYQVVKDVLELAGIWDYFVFPSISYNPKGKRVSQITQRASLSQGTSFLSTTMSSTCKRFAFSTPASWWLVPSI